MKNIGFLIIGLLLLTSCVVSANDYPVLNGYVTDNANVLTLQEKMLLNNRIASINNDTSVEIAIVTVQSTNGESLSQYATKVGDKNGVGKKSTDNGIVILVSFNNERGIFIATGKGIESVITDAEASRIYTASKGYFTNKQYMLGFNSILTGIESELKTDKSATTQPIPDTDMNAVGFISVIVVLILIFVGSVAWILKKNEDSSSYYITSTVERQTDRSERRNKLSESLAAAAAASAIVSSHRTRKSSRRESDDDYYSPSYSSHDSYESSSHESSSSSDSGFGGFGGGGFGGGGAGGGF